MELSQYLDAITADSDALARAVEAEPGHPVTACPGWDVAQLTRHLGATHRWATEIVRADTPARVPYPDALGIAEGELGAWIRVGAAQLVATLQATGPDKSVWTMGQPRTSWFWFRRQAQETALHRWDAQDALGGSAFLDSDFAADGVAELLEMFLPGLHRRGGTPGTGESFHVHRTDGPGEWSVRFDGELATVSNDHAKGDVALRGPAADLLLVLWRRRPFSSVEVFGSDEILERWGSLVPAI
jgi:uncharacterized protein (TIGR03083 family)